jgi:TolB-like protein/DNA-binding winged helix-turn-helix (wHTH) protein/Flp pilus assembly protein TadD
MNGFRLDELRIDPLTGEVAGPGGSEKLDPKVMGVLVHMAQHAGEVVSREDLLAQLWPHTVVTDDALTRCIYELRRHLSHAGGDERYRELLETLPKRGYRLNGKITFLQPKHRATAIAIAAAVLVAAIVALLVVGKQVAPVSPTAAKQDSIAVLPFLDMSAESDQRYFSDGVTEEILNRLSQSENLRVISRTSSFALRDETLDVPRIGAKLNVSYVLEGSVRKSGDRLRITAQLIDVSTNSHVWSETYDRGIGDLFAVQDEIASSVAAALQVTLAGSKARARIPENIDAYEQFLQGQFFYNRRAPGDIDRSVQYYKEAVALDPRYARAWAALSGAYSLLASGEDLPRQDMRELQGEAARRAVEIDPMLAVAHARLSQFYSHIGERAKADEEFRAAAALDPDDPLVMGFAGSRAVWRGDFDEAVALWRRIVAKDPLSPVNRKNFADILLANGRLEESLAENRKVLELQPGSGPEVETSIARILVLLEQYKDAQLAIARLPVGELQDYGLALLHLAPGRRAEADAALKRLEANARDTGAKVRLAEVYAFRGMHDAAFAQLEETRDALAIQKDERPYLSSYFQEGLRFSAFLKPLHDDPRWAKLMAAPD